MSRNQYFYSTLSLNELKQVVELHQTRFDQFLEEAFDTQELSTFERYIDSIGAIYVQPLIEELAFEDLQADPQKQKDQFNFFQNAQSSIALENMPYLESNPFQITYLEQLVNLFGNLLIDPGGDQNLMFKEDYLVLLKKFKGAEFFIKPVAHKQEPMKIHLVDPIDFLVRDVYLELERLKRSNKTPKSEIIDSEKLNKILSAMLTGPITDASTLFKKTGLSAKDFDDYLEKLKFLLRKIT